MFSWVCLGKNESGLIFTRTCCLDCRGRPLLCAGFINGKSAVWIPLRNAICFNTIEFCTGCPMCCFPDKPDFQETYRCWALALKTNQTILFDVSYLAIFIFNPGFAMGICILLCFNKRFEHYFNAPYWFPQAHCPSGSRHPMRLFTQYLVEGWPADPL